MHETNTARIPALELAGISASSGGFRILTDVSLAFPENEWSVVLGAAGSGKSTLLKTAAGLMVPDSGTVLVVGRDMAKFNPRDEIAFRSRSGFVFQDAALWANQSILNNVAMPLRVHRNWMSESQIAETCRDILVRLGYTESMGVRPAELSSGEQKLVSIARALVHQPSLVFLDDPTSNLDEDAVDRLFAELDRLRASSVTVVTVTNNTELAYRFADYLGVLKDGSLLDFGLYDATIARAEAALGSSIARLKARGGRMRSRDCAEPDSFEAGSEMSQRGDV
ncbi:MAG TPA: ATP-binding cassette domain-containing protein [Spirochaetales bacterium]|nr:ATP-binding cassette domain-containing protein [Spirochaetales bacterium]